MSEKQNLPEFPDKNTLLEYLKGGLSPSKRHRIEKMMLEYSSFREVVEGLESEDPELIGKDFQELSDKILLRTEKDIPAGFNLYRLAATVSLIIMASVILYVVVDWFTQTGHEKKLSLNKTVQTEMVDSLKDKRLADTEKEGLEMDNTVQQQAFENKQTTGIPGKEKGPSGLSAPPVSYEEPEEIKKDKTDRQPIKNHIEQIQDQFEEKSFPPEESQPVSSKQILAKEENQTAGDRPLRMTEQMNPTATTEAESEIAKQAKIKSEQPAPTGILDNPPAQEQPQPVIGSEDFRKYLEDSLRYPVEAIKNEVEGTVWLSFKIGSDSIPHHILLKESIGYGCDEEAIRLIREGPHWNPVIRGGKVIISTVEIPVRFQIPE
jgi:outer membrane biosynthesis protein TonB